MTTSHFKTKDYNMSMEKISILGIHLILSLIINGVLDTLLFLSGNYRGSSLTPLDYTIMFFIFSVSIYISGKLLFKSRVFTFTEIRKYLAFIAIMGSIIVFAEDPAIPRAITQNEIQNLLFLITYLVSYIFFIKTTPNTTSLAQS